MAWIWLGIAIVCEISGTLMLKASEGFSKFWPSIGVVAGYGGAFVLMAKSLKTIDVGITYAIWSGVGIIGAAIGGIVFFNEDLTKLNILGMAVIVAGVVVMNLGGVR